MYAPSEGLFCAYHRAAVLRCHRGLIHFDRVVVQVSRIPVGLHRIVVQRCAEEVILNRLCKYIVTVQIYTVKLRRTPVEDIFHTACLYHIGERIFRNYGSEKKYYNSMVGSNSRLDELQAGLLRVRLSHMNELNAERILLAERYRNGIHNSLIQLPDVRPGADCVWHQYVIRSPHRSELINYLNQRNIGTIIHYPIPPYLSQAYAYLDIPMGSFPYTEKAADEVLSLPMYNGLTAEEQDHVIDALNNFQRHA